MDFTILQTIILSGLVLGSLYALMSTGLSLIWGTVRMFNFAHGSLVMLGAYVAWSIGNDRGLGLGKWAGALLGCAALFGVGMLAERLLVRSFIDKRNAVIMVLITTLAASSFIDNSALIIWGARMKRLATMWPGKIPMLGGVIQGNDLLAIILAPVMLILLWLFLKWTRMGMAIRGVEQNLDFSRLVGVNVSSIYRITFGLGAAMAAVAGVLLGVKNFMSPDMGGDTLLKAFVVVVLGGLGNIPGTIGAAYIVGLLEAASMHFVGMYWSGAVLFVVMILVLLVRPTGIFGER